MTVSSVSNYMRRMRRQRNLDLIDFIIGLVLLILAIVWVLPLFLMIMTSLKGQSQLYNPGAIFPDPVVWENYPKAFFDFLPFATFFKNSLIVSTGTVIGEVLAGSFIAYGFARLKFPGRDFLFLVLLSTMMIPFAVRMVPLFVIYKQLGWINTFLPLIVPSFFGTHAFFVFLLKQFFQGIPEELAETARIEGANELQIWWYIFIPLSRPAMAVVGILAFQNSWNHFLEPLIFLNDVEMYTVSLGLYNLIGGNDAVQPWQYLMAATVISILPIVLIFFFAQRYFISGVSVSGLKG